jgi:hypothetical protein
MLPNPNQWGVTAETARLADFVNALPECLD